MTNKKKESTTEVTINASPGTFPLPELIACGAWAVLSPAAKAVIGVVWDFHRQFPLSCRPARRTIATLAGVSEPTVTRALVPLEEMGLLEVTPSAGPGVNTYRVNWSNLRVLQAATVPDNQSPYGAQKAPLDTVLHAGPDGCFATKSRRRFRHHMADGCVLNSMAEVKLHDRLVAWRLPHWANVPYHVLGIQGLHRNATVDFVLGPRLILECWGLPRTQAAAAKYNEKRKKKEKAAAAADWTLIGVEPGQVPSQDDLFEPALEMWAKCRLSVAAGLLKNLRSGDGNWLMSESHARFEEMLLDALDRKDGKKPPAEPRGLREVFHPSPSAPPAYRNVEPRIVIDASLGRAEAAPEAENHAHGAVVDLGFDEDPWEGSDLASSSEPEPTPKMVAITEEIEELKVAMKAAWEEGRHEDEHNLQDQIDELESQLEILEAENRWKCA